MPVSSGYDTVKISSKSDGRFSRYCFFSVFFNPSSFFTCGKNLVDRDTRRNSIVHMLRTVINDKVRVRVRGGSKVIPRRLKRNSEVTQTQDRDECSYPKDD